MKITVITVVRNEERLMPFFLRHYCQFADSILVYDNYSTDNTRDIVNDCKIARTISLFTHDKFSDSAILGIKNQIYRVLPGEWFVIVDGDEFIWHQDIRKYLQTSMDMGCTLPKVLGYDMVGNHIPNDDGKTQLIDIIRCGVQSDFYSKRAVVHKDCDVNYLTGCHRCFPHGRVATRTKAEIKLLHYKWMGEDFAVQRTLDLSSRLCEENIKMGWSVYDQSVERIRSEYKRLQSQAIDVFS